MLKAEIGNKFLNMDKERQLYDAFVDSLLSKVQDGSATPKELEIVLNFLKNNNIQATMSHKGLSDLVKSATDLPFEDEEELPAIKRIK